MTSLYYGGAEISSWRTLLDNEGVDHVSLSYIGLRRRTKFKRPWLLSEHFPERQKIFLDSGAYTVNSAEAEEKYSLKDLRDIAAAYMAFVQQNIDRVEFVSEFDSRVLGSQWIAAMREDFYDDLPDDKFLPIWHADLGVEELDRLCQRYSRVGVPQTALGGRNLVPVLNNLVRQYGTKLHGVAMTKPAEMAAVPWDSVASTSWISPSQFGDTIVWTGKELKRYPKKYKEQARKRHRTLFTGNGFDAEKIEADDRTEVLRLSIWSWQQLMLSLDRGEAVTTSGSTLPEPVAETEGAAVVTSSEEARNGLTTPAPSPSTVARRSERHVLPVMGVDTLREKYIDDQQQQQEREVPLVVVRSESMRMCDTCFLAAKCPAFQPKSNCAYDIPVTIRSKDQVQALQNSLLDMQTQRVFLMKMAEDMEGGYADPNLSNELDRLQKMIKIKTELEQDSFSVKFEAKGTGDAARGGMLSRLFGNDAGEKARALPAPVSADTAIVQMDVIDAQEVSY